MPFLWEVSGISIYLSDVEFVTKVKSDNFVKYFQARVKFSRISGISIYQRWSLVGKDDYLCWKLICSQPVIRSYLYLCFSYTIFVLIFANQIISFSKYLPPLTFPSPNNVFLFLLCSSFPLRTKFSFNYFPPFPLPFFFSSEEQKYLFLLQKIEFTNLTWSS